MIVTFNIPNKLFVDILNDCERKAGMPFPTIKKKLIDASHNNIILPPIQNHKDDPLLKWIAALAFDYIVNKEEIENGKVQKKTRSN